MQFDRLQPQDVSWEPYIEAVIAQHAPMGLSTMCTRDHFYWLMRSVLVFDIFVEPYCIDPVMRQLGYQQFFHQPLAFERGVRVKRKGNMNYNLFSNRAIIYLLHLCV
jgi:hypothetical protein